MNSEEEKSYYNGYTEDKPDLNQDIFNYIHNLTGSTLLFDELGGLISIFEKHGWDKKEETVKEYVALQPQLGVKPKKIKRQLLNIEVWNCNTKTKFVFSTLTRITDMQQITDAISEALNRKGLHK